MYKYISTKPFILINEEMNEEISFDVLGVYYSVQENGEGCILHKHGDYELVELGFNSHKQKYLDAGFTDIANGLRLIKVSHCDLDDLNKIIDTSALSEEYFKRLQVIEHQSKITEVAEMDSCAYCI